jgi:hypothetical protein
VEVLGDFWFSLDDVEEEAGSCVSVDYLLLSLLSRCSVSESSRLLVAISALLVVLCMMKQKRRQDGVLDHGKGGDSAAIERPAGMRRRAGEVMSPHLASIYLHPMG